jgi:hypothetical protein
MIRARMQERERHEKALLELQSQRRSTLRLLTFDTVGIEAECKYCGHNR